MLKRSGLSKVMFIFMTLIILSFFADQVYSVSHNNLNLRYRLYVSPDGTSSNLAEITSGWTTLSSDNIDPMIAVDEDSNSESYDISLYDLGDFNLSSPGEAMCNSGEGQLAIELDFDGRVQINPPSYLVNRERDNFGGSNPLYILSGSGINYESSEGQCTNCFPNADFISSHGCCGDDDDDDGSGQGDFVCYYNQSFGRYEWRNYIDHLGSQYVLEDISAGKNYTIVATDDGWHSCDDGDSGDFYRDASKHTVGDYIGETEGLTEGFICSAGASQVLSTENLSVVRTGDDDGEEMWIKCVGSGGDFSLSGINMDSFGVDYGYPVISESTGETYYCGNDKQWTTDLDENINAFYTNRLACENGAFMLEGEKYLDFGSTWSQCCGDDFVQQGETEYYEDYDASFEDDLLVQENQPKIGGCWNSHKIPHGKFLEDTIGSADIYGEGHQVLPNRDFSREEEFCEDSVQINLWDLSPGTRKFPYNENGDDCRVELNDGESISMGYPARVTPGLTYLLKIEVNSIMSGESAGDRLELSFGSQTEDIYFDNMGNPRESSAVFLDENNKASIFLEPQDALSDVSFTANVESGRAIYLKSVEMRPVERKIINYKGEFHACNDNSLADTINNHLQNSDFLESDSVCTGYEVHDGSGDQKEYFCSHDGTYSDEKMPINIRASVPSDFSEDISERTNEIESLNKYENSGFELEDSFSQCEIISQGVSGEDDSNTESGDQGGFKGNDYPMEAANDPEAPDGIWKHYLDCSGTEESKTITGLSPGDYVVSAWVKGEGDICFGDAVNGCYSYNNGNQDFNEPQWMRIHFITSISGEQADITFKGGKFDNVQIESRGTSQGVPQQEPSSYYYVEEKDGCCTPETCWTGKYCIGDFATDPDGAAKHFQGERGYMCKDGVWSYGTKKYDWTDNPEKGGFCSSDDECWVFDDDARTSLGLDDEYYCVDSGTDYRGFYCEAGKWTSKTKYVASSLISIEEDYGSSEYTLICGNYKEVLNEFDYDEGYIEEILKGDMSVGTTNACTVNADEDDPHNTNNCTNNFCVLKYMRGGQETISFGTSLNQHINEGNRFIGILRDDPEYCNNIISETGEILVDEEGLHRCRGSGSGGDVWYEPWKKIVIYSPERVGLDPSDFLFSNLDLSMITSPFQSILESITERANPPTYVDATVDPRIMDTTLFERMHLFDELFIYHSSNRAIFAAKEINYRRNVAKANQVFMMEIDGFDNIGDVCRTFHAYEESQDFGIFHGTNCTRQGDSYILIAEDDLVFEDGEFTLASGRAFDAWIDFTGKLRFP